MRVSLCLILFIIVNISYAQNPVISRNVPVMQDIEASQCPSSWNGQGPPVSTEVLSNYGSSDMIGAGILSCSGCAFNSDSKACICSMCYEYFD